MNRANPSEKLRVLSLFAGIGGFDLGLERTGGFETVAVAETDPYASKVLALRFPNAPNVGDVTTAEYPNADIICAGFPCQDISFAGAGAGLAGARSGLWREVVRAIRVVRPRYAILENVAALLSRGLGTVLGDLAEIGHDAEWHCIPAAAVGAPHRRDRIWIFSGPNSPPLLGASILGCEPDGDYAGAGEMADADRAGLEGRDGQELPERAGERLVGPSGASVADAPCELRNGSRTSAEQAGRREPSDGRWWSAEPDVGRVAHGIPKRVDRLRCLGNAVVPQIPELIGRAILASQTLSGGVSNG